MIGRVADLIALIGGFEGGLPEPRALALALKRSGVPSGRIADAILDALEDPAVRSRPPWVTWSASTAIAAGVASVLGAFGLRALFQAFGREHELVFGLPLVALPLVAVFLLRVIIERREAGSERAEMAATFIAQALLRASVPARLAFEVAVHVARLEGVRRESLLEIQRTSGGTARSVMAALAIRKATLLAPGTKGNAGSLWKRAVPVVLALGVVASFWILYFSALARGFAGGGFD